MLLRKDTPCQQIMIKEPRWKDRVVLIAKYKVGLHNDITFTNAPTLPNHYYLNGSDMSKYKISSNGKIQCYAVPIDDLEVLERI